jgi:hypothetical protein
MYADDGYTLGADGFYYNAGVAYVRTRVEVPGSLYWNGYAWYRNPSTYTYKYTVAPVKVVNNNTIIKQLTTPPAYTPDWRQKLLDVAKAREDYLAFLQALDLMGFKGQMFAPYALASQGGYLNPLNPMMSRSYYEQSAFGTQGQTAYGYSVNSLKDAYGTLDLNVAFQQAYMLTKGAQDYTAQAHSGYNGLVGAAGHNAARLAEILARGKVAAEILRSTAPQPSSHSSYSAGGVTVAPAIVPTPSVAIGAAGSPALASADAANLGRAKLFLQEVGVPKCLSCHGGKDASGNPVIKGGFNILSFPTMTRAQQAAVIERVFTTDKDKVMPRAISGGPGEVLDLRTKLRFALVE